MRKSLTHRLAVLLAASALAAFSGGCAKNSVQDNAPEAVANGTVSAKHILVMYRDSERAPAEITRSKEEARILIDEVLAKVKSGEKFEDLAREYSDCPSAAKGGDLGAFGRNQMAAAFEAASFACDVGGTTDVVETPFGYHIIYRYK